MNEYRKQYEEVQGKVWAGSAESVVQTVQVIKKVFLLLIITL